MNKKDIRWVDFITGSNTITITNENEFNKFKEFLNCLGLDILLNNYNNFSDWQQLSKINKNDPNCIIFEYQPNKGLTFGYTKESSKKWYGIESYTTEVLDSFFDNNKLYDGKYKTKKVKILGTWITDYDDIACNAILYQNGKEVANVMDSFEETTVRYIYGDSHTELTDELINKSLEKIINESFENYLELPKISECSKLLQEIYDRVCDSVASMCHVDSIDWISWKDCYNFTDDDIEQLKEEIKRYKLNEEIGIDDCGYKIVGYGNLQFAFNDDRNLAKENQNSLEI